jgi:hypothetical protein
MGKSIRARAKADPALATTFGARSKRASTVRGSGEFDLARMVERLRPTRQPNVGGTTWVHETIRAARDAQMRGHFYLPKQLAAIQKTDDGLFSALRNRLAPTTNLPVVMRPANDSSRARAVCAEAEAQFGQQGIAIRPDTIVNAHEDLANHGLFVLCGSVTPRPDGSRVDARIDYWPLQHVWYDHHKRELKTRTEERGEETICHGDGRWIVGQVCQTDPWQSGATIATANIWEDRAFGKRDRARASTSHGNAKMVGELPPEIPIDSPEGAAFLQMLATMHEALPYGLRPSGSKMEMLVNTSSSWQIFQEIIKGSLGDGARIYLGHDGSTSAIGGNYIKDGLLYGVTVSIVENDLAIIRRALFEGAIVPWTAVNFGDSTLAPSRDYEMPDADADARDDSLIKRRKAAGDEVKAARENGIVVDQAFIDATYKGYRLDPPVIATAANPGAPASATPAGPAGPSPAPAVPPASP